MRVTSKVCVACVRAAIIPLRKIRLPDVVYGMSKAAVQPKAASEILPLDQIGPRVAGRLLRKIKGPCRIL